MRWFRDSRDRYRVSSFARPFLSISFFFFSIERGSREGSESSSNLATILRARIRHVRVRVSHHPRQEQDHERQAQAYHERRRAKRGRCWQVESVSQFLGHVHVDLVDSHVFDKCRKLRGVDAISLRRPDRQRRVGERGVLQQGLYNVDILCRQACSYGISYRLRDVVFL